MLFGVIGTVINFCCVAPLTYIVNQTYGFTITNNNIGGASNTIFSNGNGGVVVTNNNVNSNGFNTNNVNVVNNGK